MTAYEHIDGTDAVRRLADGAVIPADVSNSDWQAYQDWINAGNEASQAPTIQAPAPALDFLQFVALFTTSEQAAIFGATDVKVRQFTFMAAGTSEIHLSDDRVVGGVNYLAATGLVAPSRVTDILAGRAPA